MHKTAAVTLICLLLLSCSDDPEQVEVTHYSNPVWSSDDKTVAAGYVHYLSEGGGGPPGLSQIAVRDVATRAQAIYTVDGDGVTPRLWFVPGTSILAVRTSAMRFYTMTGLAAGNPVVMNGHSPSLAAFSPANSRVFLVSAQAGALVIGYAQYVTSPFELGEIRVFLDTVFAGEAFDAVATSDSSVCVNFSDGRILEYSITGRLLTGERYEPFLSSSQGHNRLGFYKGVGVGTRYVYFLARDGVQRLNLENKSKERIVGANNENVVDFDVNTPARTLIFETSRGDLWLADPDKPSENIVRLRYRQKTPRLSNEGKSFVSVGLINENSDSLTVIRFRL